MGEIKNRELVVVGGGVAGCTAAMYAKRYNLDLVLLEKGAPGGQTATAAQIENYPGFPDGIGGMELADRVHRQAENVGVEFMLGTAEAVEREGEDWVRARRMAVGRPISSVPCSSCEAGSLTGSAGRTWRTVASLNSPCTADQ